MREARRWCRVMHDGFVHELMRPNMGEVRDHRTALALEVTKLAREKGLSFSSLANPMFLKSKLSA